MSAWCITGAAFKGTMLFRVICWCCSAFCWCSPWQRYHEGKIHNMFLPGLRNAFRLVGFHLRHTGSCKCHISCFVKSTANSTAGTIWTVCFAAGKHCLLYMCGNLLWWDALCSPCITHIPTFVYKTAGEFDVSQCESPCVKEQDTEISGKKSGCKCNRLILHQSRSGAYLSQWGEAVEGWGLEPLGPSGAQSGTGTPKMDERGALARKGGSKGRREWERRRG